jgi:hypothetical protein
MLDRIIQVGFFGALAACIAIIATQPLPPDNAPAPPPKPALSTTEKVQLGLQPRRDPFWQWLTVNDGCTWAHPCPHQPCDQLTDPADYYYCLSKR